MRTRRMYRSNHSVQIEDEDQFIRIAYPVPRLFKNWGQNENQIDVKGNAESLQRQILEMENWKMFFFMLVN